MRKLTIGILFFGLIAALSPVKAQQADAHEKLKKHINSIVLKVEKADEADEKRTILNNSLDELVSAIDQVEQNKMVPETDKEALAGFKNDLIEKKNELNGQDGFAKVPDNRLNDFAQYVQQDMEQADRVVTISLTTALLIVIILLLL